MSTQPRTVLVTGGSRGIGLAVADHYKARGWHVVAPPRDLLNVSDAESIAEFFGSYSGTLSALINNAGINPVNLIEDVAEEDLLATIQTNLLGPFRLLRAASPFLRQAPGIKYVVNISSIWAAVSKPGRSAYSMAKSGLQGLTRSAAVEWARLGILVNSVGPGFTRTELTAKNNDEGQLREIEQSIPLGRLAEPSDIAGSVYMLGSELNTYITGQTLFVDGGFTCL